MSTSSEPVDPQEPPRSVHDLRQLQDLSLSETSGKRVSLPPSLPPHMARRTTPLPAPAPATPPAATHHCADAPRAITDEEYRKIRARLREDFVVIPKRRLRHAGVIVGSTLVLIGLVGLVTARQAGRAAALGFMQSELGEMVKKDEQDLDLETREALARSRSAAEAAIDAQQQAVVLLDRLQKQLAAVQSLETRVRNLEQARK
jgi:hypothetical protein